MSTLKRRSRRRTTDRRPLFEAWQAGEPPPSWAYEHGEAHHEEIGDLIFFTDPAVLSWTDQPHYTAWLAAMDASKPPADTARA